VMHHLIQSVASVVLDTDPPLAQLLDVLVQNFISVPRF